MTASRLSGFLTFVALASMGLFGCSEKASVSVPPPAEVVQLSEQVTCQDHHPVPA